MWDVIGAKPNKDGRGDQFASHLNGFTILRIFLALSLGGHDCNERKRPQDERELFAVRIPLRL